MTSDPRRPLRTIVATDCGSTTTKAILIERVGDEYRQTYRGEAPTTVEAPFEDVTRGVLNAIAEIEEYIAAAEPRPRLGMSYNLPLIYAGNKDARARVSEILGNKTDPATTEN